MSPATMELVALCVADDQGDDDGEWPTESMESFMLRSLQERCAALAQMDVMNVAERDALLLEMDALILAFEVSDAA